MSSVSVRIFFITDEDEILKVPIAKFERMLKGSYEEKTERFAGKRKKSWQFRSYCFSLFF